MYDHNAVKIYTDGSARPTNPGRGGIGIVVEYPDNMGLDNFELSEGYLLSTNNRMELMAVIRAMEWLEAESRGKKLARAIIITDSEYVYDHYKSAQYWKANGWRNGDGKPYENPDLWDIFLKQHRKLRFHNEIAWEKGKTREVLRRVDALAKQGSGNSTKTDHGYSGGKFTAPRTKSKKGATLFPAHGQDALIRIYKKRVYGKGDRQIYKVTFDLYDEGTKAYVEKHVAYLGKDCPDLKRNNCYRASFDSSAAFPRILVAEPVEYLKGT
ncbi:MAG TPA: ribonuclease H [Candidatus Paceibacterota bacterium]|nr:ribonuclease H [Candidatus Paceibacterota bacterium]